MRGNYETKSSYMLPSIGCSECEEIMGLNRVMCCIPLDVQNVRKIWD